MSSGRVVLRFVAHDMRAATLKFWICVEPATTKGCIPVMEAILSFQSHLSPKMRQFLSKNMTFEGARSSCNVQPRVNLIEEAGYYRAGWIIEQVLS